MLRRVEWKAVAEAIARFRRHDRRAWIIRTVLIGIALIASTHHPFAPKFIWNASASVPVGLYRVETQVTIVRGDLVLAWLPDQARRLADERHYLPANVPLVKRIAAMPGDTVCSVGEDISINGTVVAKRLAMDGQGRPMPSWNGCRMLGSNEVFLLMASVPDSFDGRYFGSIGADRIVGRLVPVWTR